MNDVAELLDRAMPRYAGTAGNWTDVLRDAGVGAGAQATGAGANRRCGRARPRRLAGCGRLALRRRAAVGARPGAGRDRQRRGPARRLRGRPPEDRRRPRNRRAARGARPPRGVVRPERRAPRDRDLRRRRSVRHVARDGGRPGARTRGLRRPRRRLPRGARVGRRAGRRRGRGGRDARLLDPDRVVLRAARRAGPRRGRVAGDVRARVLPPGRRRAASGWHRRDEDPHVRDGLGRGSAARRRRPDAARPPRRRPRRRPRRPGGRRGHPRRQAGLGRTGAEAVCRSRRRARSTSRPPRAPCTA